ncbi:MAG: hypothetical protein LBT50_05880 [Prevotellaceae bacterium]|nr:hypothetical protein [Prevotellaceae bacterium]
MKKIVYLMIMIVAGFSYSCKEMDSIYQEFVVPNGLVYPQKADSLKIYSGVGKVRITWFKAKDPNVAKARIYWNNYTDSIDVSIPANSEIVSANIAGLDENTYTFYVVTYDDDNNASIPNEITGAVFGDSYIIGLAMRPILSETVDRTGIWTINWGNANIAGGAIATEIEYQKSDGSKKTITIPVSETVTVISDAETGTEYRYRTLYFVPEKFMETVPSSYTTRIMPPKIDEVLIPRDRFRNAALPGDYYDAYASAYSLEKLWDGGIAGIYSTKILSPPKAPQHFTIELGRTVIISRFKMFPRNGNSELYTGGGPRFIEVWGSMDPPPDGSWDNWYKIGEWEQYKPSGYGAGVNVGTVTTEDEAWLRSGGNYVVGATAAIPNPFIPIKYLRFNIVHTFGTYAGVASGNMTIAELEFYGGIIEE